MHKLTLLCKRTQDVLFMWQKKRIKLRDKRLFSEETTVKNEGWEALYALFESVIVCLFAVFS